MNNLRWVRQRTICGRIRRLRRDESGVLLIITALLLPILLAILGLSLDVGIIYDDKRRQQNAADSGAMGGAHELWRGNTDKVQSSAKDDTKRNGFDDNDSDVTVTVTNPYSGDANKVEVIITEEVPVYFARVFGVGTVTVQSRAVAGLVAGAYGDGCVIILDEGNTRAAFKVPGNAEFTADCGLMVNSKHNLALVQSGSSTITATDIGVTGNYRMNGGATMYANYMGTGMPPVIDPFWEMTPPDPTDTITYPLRATDLWISSTPAAPLEPGYYVGGIKIDGLGTVVNFNPGIYILDANAATDTKSGLQISGSSINTGIGVMFYNINTTGIESLWGDLSIAGSSQNTFKAPAYGYYSGILFWNDASAPYQMPGSVIAGSSASLFEGVMYFPSTHLAFRGTSANSGWQMIVAYTASSVGTNSMVSMEFDAGYAGTPTVLSEATLLE